MITPKRTPDGQVYYVIGMDPSAYKEGQKELRDRLTVVESLLVKVLRAQRQISNLPSLQRVFEPWTEEETVGRVNLLVDRENEIKRILAEVHNA